MSGHDELGNETVVLYNRMQMEEVFHIPSSGVHVEYPSIGHSSDKGVMHRVEGPRLGLLVYATSIEEGTDVIAAFFANERLMVAKAFGARHGALLYVLPVFHLMVFLVAEAIVLSSLDFAAGIVIGVAAVVTIPLLVFWAASSLETRRLTLKSNLEMTGRFGNSEIDEVVAWLHTKTHSRQYWTRRTLFYEIFYVSLTLLLILSYLY